VSKRSRSTEKAEWVLPASIPFAGLKGHDLEECVYWLLDSMGAKDLEWRTGGSGGGAADGGRDLEAAFYTPTVDGEIEAQKWWIECKGRTGTVEPDQVKSTVTNALAIEGLDYVVIATNTQFSNPTRDWVKVWQAKNPGPKIKLWDHAQLERYLSRHPDVVLRLFSEALSLEGRLKAMESRFWNKLEFVTPKTLTDIWGARKELQFEPAELFALVANEFAGGNIIHRPWGATLSASSAQAVLAVGVYNVTYLVYRSSKAGIDQRIIHRTFAYLILAALDSSPAADIAELILISLNRGEDELLPEQFQDLVLTPILSQLLSEMQDVCASNCRWMISTDRKALGEGQDEIADYWLRLEPNGIEEAHDRRFLQLEKLDEPSVVGFPVDADNGCPLFHTEPEAKTTGNLLAIIKRVAEFRKREAAAKRESENQRVTRLRKRPAVPLG
jgi:Restriction endonuclease